MKSKQQMTGIYFTLTLKNQHETIYLGSASMKNGI